ncbi:HD domain-containing protein, partial [Acinetobacter baumannii]
MDGQDAAWRDFWGKARPAEGAPARWHPLWKHALDVAAAGRLL